jgi:osmoprotectant transport system permease protein
MLDLGREVWRLYTVRTDFFLSLLGQHLYLSAVSIAIAFFLGGAVGVACARNQAVKAVSMAVVNFLYTIPSIAFFGVLIAFTGIGDTTAIIVLSAYALLPMVRNTCTGISNIDPDVMEAAAGMGTPPLTLLWRIQLPLALPMILTGLRNMSVMVVATAGIAAFVGAGGLGVAIWRGITTYNLAMAVAGSLLIAFLALSCQCQLPRRY